MTTYIECFNIGGSQFGIEDHLDGAGDDEHFFPHSYRDGTTKRFHLWRNGGGFGQADTLKQARQVLFDYAVQILSAEGASAKQTFELAEANLKMLGSDTAHLFRFEEKSA